MFFIRRRRARLCSLSLTMRLMDKLLRHLLSSKDLPVGDTPRFSVIQSKFSAFARRFNFVHYSGRKQSHTLGQPGKVHESRLAFEVALSEAHLSVSSTSPHLSATIMGHFEHMIPPFTVYERRFLWYMVWRSGSTNTFLTGYESISNNKFGLHVMIPSM